MMLTTVTRVVWLSAMLAVPLQAQVIQYWDTADTAGLQGGSGDWTAASLWATNLAKGARAAWTPGNVAWFSGPSNGVASAITLTDRFNVASVIISNTVLPCALVVTNGGQMLAGSLNSVIGRSATGNTVSVTGSNSWWDVGGKNLTVGLAAGGVSNLLTVAAGGVVSNFNLFLGDSSAATFGNRVVVNGGVLALQSNQTVSIGERGFNNTVILTNGACVMRGNHGGNGSATVLGNGGAASSSNALLITRGCVWDNGNSYLYLGSAAFASGNRVVIDGGSMTNIGSNQRVVIGTSDNTFGNSIIVTNGGLLQWGNNRNLNIGYGTNSYWNTLEVADGATAIGSANNTYVGWGASSWSNAFIIRRGGTVTNMLTLQVGAGAGSTNNTMTLDGGRLYVQKNFTIVNPGNFLTFKGGLLSINMTSGGTTANPSDFSANAQPLLVGDGTQDAVLDVQGLCSVPYGLIVTNGATFSGVGFLYATAGVTTVYGTVNPGIYSNTTGQLLHNGALTLKAGATVQIEIASTNRVPGAGWDRLVVTNGTLTLGGTLKPVLRNGFVPAGTNSFPYVLSNSVAFAGAFDALTSGSRVNAYSNDLATVVGSFSVGISNNYVVLDGFVPASGSTIAVGTVVLLR